MSNPPTYNDLKRLRNKSGLKRFKIVNASVTPPPPPLLLDAFNKPDNIAVDSVDILATTIAEFAVSIYTGDNTNNTIGDQNLIFYPNNINITPEGYAFNKSVWTLGDHQQLSYDFSYPVPNSPFTVKQDFWDESNETKTSQTLTISTIPFSEINTSIENTRFTGTVTISTDSFNPNDSRVGGLVFRFVDPKPEIIGNELLIYDPLSVYKDDIFLKEINYKKTATLVAVASGAQSYLQGAEGSDLRITNIEIPMNEINLSLSSSYINKFLNYGNAYRGTLKSTTDNDFGYLVYNDLLSAGEYEFKFAVRDHLNQNNRYQNSTNLTVEQYSEEMWNESLSSVISIVEDNPVYSSGYTHLKVLTSASFSAGGWNPDFWGFSARDTFNFSGVCWDSNAAQALSAPCPRDRSNITATLLTPRHAVAAEHYYSFTSGSGDERRTQAWQAGDHIYFYDHTTGEGLSAIVQDEMKLWNTIGPPNLPGYEGNGSECFWFFEPLSATAPLALTPPPTTARILSDVQLLYLDRDMTLQGDIKVYRLAKAINSFNWPDYKYPIITTKGRNRDSSLGGVCAGIGLTLESTWKTAGTRAIERAPVIFPELNGIDTATTAVTLSSTVINSYESRIPENYTFDKLKDGDSGGANFLYINNELLFYTHWTSADFSTGLGTGPNYSHPNFQEILQLAINEIGNTEGYQLSTVDVI